MLQINYQKNWYEFEFHGIKIIETDYTTNFIKSILSEYDENSKLIIDNKNIKWKNIIYINELSTINDFLSLNKSNFLYKKIIETIEDNSLVNQNLINNIIDKINNELELEDLLLPQYDISKIISACFELNNLGYLDETKIINLLNKLDFDEKKLIVFDNVKFATYENCKKLLNNFNILIICSDLRNVINNFKQLELCVYVNNFIFEIINVEKIISYLELKTSLLIEEKDLNDYLSKKVNKKSSTIHFYLKNIENI